MRRKNPLNTQDIPSRTTRVLQNLAQSFFFFRDERARLCGQVSAFLASGEGCQSAFRIVGLPSVPQDLGPKPSAYLGKWVKNPRRGNFIRSKKTRGHRGANKDSAGFLIV